MKTQMGKIFKMRLYNIYAAVADKALTVKSHYISILQQEEMLETMELKNEIVLYASLDTPREVQVLFPALEETLTLPDDLVKYLEDKSKVADLQDVAE